MMPRGAASVSWGAHRMEYADGVADRSHLSAKKSIKDETFTTTTTKKSTFKPRKSTH
jgi:hypothetical protein